VSHARRNHNRTRKRSRKHIVAPSGVKTRGMGASPMLAPLKRERKGTGEAPVPRIETASSALTAALDANAAAYRHAVQSVQHAASTVFGPGLQEYVPVAGSTTGPVPTSYIEIEVTPIPVANPTSVDVVLSYGFQPLGGGPQNVGHIKTTLTNIGLKP